MTKIMTKILLLIFYPILLVGQTPSLAGNAVDPGNSSVGTNTPQFVQAGPSTVGITNVPINNVVAGHALIAFGSWQTTSALTACTGTGGNWIIGPFISDPVQSATIGSCVQLSAPGGNEVVTFTTTGAALNSYIIEYVGLALTSIDSAVSNLNLGSGSPNGHSCGTLTTTANGDLIVSGIIDTENAAPAATITPGTLVNYVMRYNSNVAMFTADSAEEDFIQEIHGSITPTWTFDAGHPVDRSVCVSLALKRS
jgi:hypothetical protein